MAIISHINVNNEENPIASNNMLYGVCSTAAATAAKTVTISDSKFTLQTGAVVTVKFTHGNSTNNSPTLNVDSTGAKDIYMSGIRQWQLNENGIYTFIYDGTNWNILNPFTVRGIADALGFNPADNAAVEAFAEQVNQTFEEFDETISTKSTVQIIAWEADD